MKNCPDQKGRVFGKRALFFVVIRRPFASRYVHVYPEGSPEFAVAKAWWVVLYTTVGVEVGRRKERYGVGGLNFAPIWGA